MKHNLMLALEDFIDRSLRKGDNKQVSIGTSFDIRHCAKVSADEQAFAFSDLVFRKVICHTVFQARIINADLISITGQVEVEEVTFFKVHRSCAHEQISLKLRS